jgi:hypothetical protein
MVYSAVTFVTVLVYLACYAQLRSSILKHMWIYLVIILVGDYFVTELVKFIFPKLGYMDANLVYYSTILMPCGFVYFNWLYFQKLRNSKFKVIPIISLLTYIVALIIEAFVSYKVGNYNILRYAFITGSFGLLVTIIFYLYELMMSDQILDFTKERFFYISIGLFVFYIIGLPKFVFLHLFSNVYYDYVMLFFNTIMYTLFCLAAIWGKRD